MLTSCFWALFDLPLHDSAATIFVFITLTLFYILLEKKRHIWDTQVLYYFILFYFIFFYLFYLDARDGDYIILSYHIIILSYYIIFYFILFILFFFLLLYCTVYY